jgi:hypothetical protein
MAGASRRAVYRYLALDGSPERRRRHHSGHRVLASYESYLQRRWTEGCRNRSRLFREIRLLGYHYSARPVTTRVPSARHVACMLVWHKDRLPEQERE